MGKSKKQKTTHYWKKRQDMKKLTKPDVKKYLTI